METFRIGEIIWAKVRGYPWWPAEITHIENHSKDKKFSVNFLGDNTSATLSKKSLGNFEKEYLAHSQTKKKLLLEAIKIAKAIIGNEPSQVNDCAAVSSSIPQKEIEKETTEVTSNEERSKAGEEKSKKKRSKIGKKPQEVQGGKIKIQQFSKLKNSDKPKGYLKRKKKRNEEPTESGKEGVNENDKHELIIQIIYYLVFISEAISSNDMLVIENDKQCLMKVFEFLREYKMKDPIQFLEQTCIGKMVKYINVKVEDQDIKESSSLVYKNFEQQLLDHIFKKKRSE